MLRVTMPPILNRASISRITSPSAEPNSASQRLIPMTPKSYLVSEDTMDGLTEGRMVHYVLPDGPSAGQHRPAVVVHVWRDIPDYVADGRVQLQVFTDGTNDGGDYAGGLVWRTSVKYSEEKEPGTWHWIEKA